MALGALLAAGVVISGCSGVGSSRMAASSAVNTGPTRMVAGRGVDAHRHILLIMLENHGYKSIIGNPKAPHINRLAQNYGLATHYHGITHPSEPNYVATIGGDYFGIQDDRSYVDHVLDQASLASELETARLSWKGYFQSLPSVGYLGTAYPSASEPRYVSKHNPFLNFRAVQNSRSEQRKLVPISQFSLDLAAGHLPNFSYIVPDECHDMHGISGHCVHGLVKTADTYVGSLVERILRSPAWRLGTNDIVVTWDESESMSGGTCCDAPGGGHGAAIVITNRGPRHVVDATPYSHYSLLRTIQDAFGLPCLQYTCDTARVKLMKKLFR